MTHKNSVSESDAHNSNEDIVYKPTAIEEVLESVWEQGRSHTSRHSAVQQALTQINEFGHEVYSHNTATGWCCACDADIAWLNSEIETKIEAENGKEL